MPPRPLYLALLCISCGGETAPASPDAGQIADASPADATVLDRLQSDLEAAASSAVELTGGQLSLSVVDLESARRADIHADRLHISASTAKAYWTAAALDEVGVASVSAHAEPVFEVSDNFAAGVLIDFVGPDAVNDWQWSVGLGDTALTSWGFGMPRTANNSPRRLGNNNYTTTRDAVLFLQQLASDSLLANAESEALLTWMTLSPRQGFGGWFGTGLPAEAQAAYHHKAGWLPPGCCSSDPNSLLDMGIVPYRAGRYAYAVFLRHGDWTAQERAMPFLACTIHAAMSDQAGSCSLAE